MTRLLTTSSLAAGLLGMSLSLSPAFAAEPTTTAPTTAAEAPTAGAAPTDAQIMAVAAAANKGEISAAKLAITRAQDKGVKSFAKMMVSDHTGVLTKADMLGKKLGVQPASSPASQALEASNEKAEESLKPLKKSAFDRAYIDQQVTAHQEVLDSLDKTLIPGAQNPELKGLLQKVRPTVAAHLDQAKQLQAKLSKSS